MTSQQNPAAILFDWDGTLVESLKAIHAAHNVVLGHFGLPTLSYEEARRDLRQSAREKYVSLFGAEKAPDAFNLYYETILKNHLDELEMLPHAEDFLSFVRTKQIPMGVVSNKRHMILEKEIAHLGWNNFFSAIVGAGQAERDKPAADPILLATDALNLDPSNIWYVGDTDTDMKAANNAGCMPIFIEHGYGERDEILPHNPHLIVKDLIDLQSKLA